MKITSRMTCFWYASVFHKPIIIIIIKQEQHEEYVYQRRGTYDE
jgi:hypothetical protein